RVRVGVSAATIVAGIGLSAASVLVVLRERRRRRAIGKYNVPFWYLATGVWGAGVGIAAKLTWLGRFGFRLTPALALMDALVLCTIAVALGVARRRPIEVAVALAGAGAVAAMRTGAASAPAITACGVGVVVVLG